ncbi:MAG: hypothetical protein JWL89_273 [Candidatus Saccharibacteria bacterium]|nr:hypothetical protein [Candidatus Saccharibacteria bacterium]
MQDDFKPSKRSAGRSLRDSLDSVADNTKETKIDTPDRADVFQTPEEVAAEQTLTPDEAEATSNIPEDDKPSKKDWKAKFAFLKDYWPPKGRKEWAILTLAILLIAGLGFLAVKHFTQSKLVTEKKISHAKYVPKITTVPSTLTGLQVDKAVNDRVVTAVMIENSMDARPQSGLGQAGVVFEAIAEGGITRFLAIFQDTAPDNIGPVRSARPYYVQWAQGFDAGYAHVGGSPEALSNIKAWGVRDLDQFANGGSYHRISTREAPHNVYTSIATLNELEKAKGYNSSKYTGFARKLKDTPAKVPTAKAIDIAISSALYNVHYDYQAATNTYNRSEGGAGHIDANTNTAISPKNVVVLAMQYGLEADDHHSQYATIGSGAAKIYQDGTVVDGTWTKADGASQFTFTDAAGKPIKLNPGQTWITAVGSIDKVSSAP